MSKIEIEIEMINSIKNKLNKMAQKMKITFKNGKQQSPENSQNIEKKQNTLNDVFDYLRTELNQEILQQLSDCVISINTKCVGDGRGLLGGALTDMFICDFFKEKLKNYEENHIGESDLKICDVLLSFKKISKKSDLALDWSKNNNPSQKNYFTNHMMVLNLFSAQWWKTGHRNNVIEAGIYLIDKCYCQKNVKLTSNNKSNSIIKSDYLYGMLMNSLHEGLFIPIPQPKNTLQFSLVNAFKIVTHS